MVGFVTNIKPAEASAPIVYGLALATPPEAVNRLATALTRYRQRIKSPWRHYTPQQQAILTCAWMEFSPSR